MSGASARGVPLDRLFLDRLLVLLAQGSFTATYKYALVLALIDLCVQGAADGQPPTSVTTRQVAERFVVQYWLHDRPYGGVQSLYQTSTRAPGGDRAQAGVLQAITELKRRLGGAPTTPAQAQRLDPAGWAQTLDQVEWTVASEPIPRLQLLNGRLEPLLYQIGWSAKASGRGPREPDLPRIQRGDLRRPGFDNTLRLLHGVPEQLVALAAVLRPLVQRLWSDQVARLNRLPEHQLEDFLFGPERVDLKPVRAPLVELQRGRCFYCDGPLRLHEAQVDHVLPWSRVPLDDLGNLVVADGSCNGSKSSFLASEDHIHRWTERDPRALAEQAQAVGWDFTPGQAQRAARVLYTQVLPGTPLWAGRGSGGARFTEAEPAALGALLARLGA